MTIPPVPSTVKDTLFKSFLNKIRDGLNGRVNFPIYTTTERNAINNWNDGDTIFNSSTLKKETYYNGNWYSG